MVLESHGQMATLLGLVAKLPAGKALTRPLLQTAVAWANVSLHRSAPAQAALNRIDTFLAGPPRREADRVLAVEADVLRGVLAVTADHTDGVEELVAPCLNSPDDHSPWLVSVAANLSSFLKIHRFEFDEARAQQRWAAPYHRRSNGPFSAVYGSCYAGLAATEQLDVAGAEESYQHALQVARESMAPDRMRYGWRARCSVACAMNRTAWTRRNVCSTRAASWDRKSRSSTS